MFLTHGSVEVDVVATGGEFEGERPDDFFVIDIVGVAEDAPEVGELETGELAGDEMVGLGVAEEGRGGRIVAKNAVEALKIGGEKVVCLDENTVFARADNGIGFCGVFDGGDVTLGVGDEIVFRDAGGEFGEGVQRLAGGFTFLGNITDEMGGFETIIPFVDMGISETDIETVLVDSVLKIRLAGVFAGVMTPDAFVGESKVAVGAGDGEGVALKELARGGEPIVVAADKTFVVFADGEDSAAVLMRIGLAALLVDGAGDFFIE